MSKFNTSSIGTNKTVNKSGYTAYKMEDKLKLTTMVLTSFFNEKKYYGDNSKEIIELASKVDTNFVANLAVYARKEFNLRSVSHVLTCIVAHSSSPIAKNLVEKACLRADDMTEILSCYLNMYGKPIPNGLKKGLARAFNKFDEYQLAKYNRDTNVKFKDILSICHPKPSSIEQSGLFKKVLEDNLEIPYTWETQLSEKGNTKEVWEDLINSGKVGHMALIRNLRNILNAQPNNIDIAIERISNENEVKKGKQLPFRYYSAYKSVKDLPNISSKIISSLEQAISYSCNNIEKIKGKTLIAVDVSGSMKSSLSQNSQVTCREIGAVMGAIANRICEDSVIVLFDTSLKQLVVSNTDGILSTANMLLFNGGGTNLNLPLEWAIENKVFFDRMIMFSDDEINSGWDSSYWRRTTGEQVAQEYRNKINKNLWVHAVDLLGYGTQQFIGNKSNIIAGWSEKVFTFINLVEGEIDNLVSVIERYSI